MHFKQLSAGLIALALVAGAVALFWPSDEHGAAGAASSQDGQAGKSQEPIDVGFVEVERVRINRTDPLPGRVLSFQVAEIRPQVSGIIQSRSFDEGSFVDEGQQLYQIDPARYEAALERAEAGLEEAGARARNARNLVERYEELVDDGAISEQDYDDALARLDQAEAAVSLAQAEVKAAEIDLGFTRVYAPISGYISPSTVTRGALVTARQETALATIRQLDPVYVDLAQTAAEARKLQERLAISEARDDQGRYAVTLYLKASEEAYPHTGMLDATDLAVDVQTGAIRLRSVFPNPDRALLPGMFVRASIEAVGTAHEILIPQKAVTIEPEGGKSVWLVGPDETARKQPVRTGAAYASRWVVLDGLERGDRLITEGTMNLREGAPLRPEELATVSPDRPTDMQRDG